MAKNRGFTLLELVIAIAILGVMMTIVLVAINPVQKMAAARDAGRITAIKQLGNAISRYSLVIKSFPENDTWDQDLVEYGDLASFPGGVDYVLATTSTCQTNARPESRSSYCYSYDPDLPESGAIVYSRLESDIHRDMCMYIGDTYIIYSASDRRTGIICSGAEPTPWPIGTKYYIQ